MYNRPIIPSLSSSYDNFELEFWKAHSFTAGFMKQNFWPDDMDNPYPLSTSADGPLMVRKPIADIVADIEDTLKASEYKVLTTTNFESSKEKIIKFRDILTKLINAGVFDDETTDQGVINNRPYCNPAPNNVKPADYSKLMRDSYELKPDWSVLNTPKIEAGTVLTNGDVSYYNGPTVESLRKEQVQQVLSAKSIPDKEERDAVMQTIVESHPIVEPITQPTTTKQKDLAVYEGSYIELIVKPSKEEFAKTLDEINKCFVGKTDFVENNIVVSAIDRLLQISVTVCMDDLENKYDALDGVEKMIMKLGDFAIRIIRFRTTKLGNFDKFESKCKETLTGVSIFKTTGKWGILAFMGTFSTTVASRILSLITDFTDNKIL